jgi:hypothetical protein
MGARRSVRHDLARPGTPALGASLLFMCELDQGLGAEQARSLHKHKETSRHCAASASSHWLHADI